MSTIDQGDLFAGISDFHFDSDTHKLGRGLVLRKCHIRLANHYLLITQPASPDNPFGAPWRPAQGGSEYTVTAELEIPYGVADHYNVRLEIARTIVFLLRLWDPAITLRILSNKPISTLSAPEEEKSVLIPFEISPRKFPLSLSDRSTPSNLPWVTEKWETTSELLWSSREFRLAVAAMDAGQFLPDDGLTLLSLWAAIEALFLKRSSGELRFRLSTLIASYLRPPGDQRADLQKRVLKLYDRRSGAAHGNPNHSDQDVLDTYNILRETLVKVIQNEAVPTPQQLENLLLGASEWR